MSESSTGGVLDTGQQVTQAAADKAGEVSQHAGEQAQAVAGTAVEQARQVGSEAASQARDLVGQARQQGKQQAETQIQELADALAKLGQQGRALLAGRRQDAGPLPDLAEQVIAKVEDLAERTRTGGVDGLASQGRTIAARRPGAFLAGAAGLGLVVGRLLRAGALQSAQGKSPDKQSQSPPQANATPWASTSAPAPAVDDSYPTRPAHLMGINRP